MSDHVKYEYRDSLLPDVKFKGRKICVLTNYRSGSTFFIRETFLTNRIAPMGDWEHFNNKWNDSKDKDFDFLLNQLKQRSAFVFKLMPDQIGYSKIKYDKILQECDEVVYLYRRDFQAQAKGWIAWNVTGDHDHQYGDYKQYDVKVTQKIADECIDELISNYKFMKTAYKERPGNVYCLEDFPIQVPYARLYNWQNEIIIPDFNTHKELFRS